MDRAIFTPKIPSREAQRLILEQGKTLNEWRNFARRCKKDLAIYNFVIKKKDYKCALGGKPSRSGFHLHHTDYLHACIYDSKKPDCANCKIKSPEFFQQCASR